MPRDDRDPRLSTATPSNPAGETPGLDTEPEPARWICPGPEWPPEDETCGRILDHDARCPECRRRRTLLRKEAARIRRALRSPLRATRHGRSAA